MCSLEFPRPKAPTLGCSLEKQQQNRAIVTPILGNEVGASLPVQINFSALSSKNMS